jgi:hypothetical protein
MKPSYRNDHFNDISMDNDEFRKIAEEVGCPDHEKQRALEEEIMNFSPNNARSHSLHS